MGLTPSDINRFTMFKLPSAWLCGIRVKEIDSRKCVVKVRYRWINQNPFKSMFWAVQGMAAELSTGAMVMAKIKESNKPISMLVSSNNAVFSKKARGMITFSCNDGEKISAAIDKALLTGEGQTFWMRSVGTDNAGDEVSVFNFEWSIKVRV